MKTNLLKSWLMLVMLLLGVGTMWAEDADYTLTPSAGSNNSYAGNCDVTIGSITWNVTGNAQQIPWRLGGKSLSNEDRTVYSKTAYTSAVSKVDLTVGGASDITVNSLKLVYSTNSDFSNSSEISKTFSANSTISFEANFPANAYYKFVFNVTVSDSKNKFVEFSKVEFYNNGGDTPGKTTPTLSFAKATYNATMGEDFTAPTLTNSQNVTVEYTSSETSVATVNATTGAISLVAPGTTKITASFEGNETYNEASASYQLVVAAVPAPALTTMDEIFAAATAAGSTATDCRITFNNWVVSGVKGNNAYVTDNAGKGLIVYTSGHGFEVGDILSGTAACKVQLYRGAAELTTLTSSTEGLTVTKGGVVTPVTSVALASLSGVNTGAVLSYEGLTYNGSVFTDGETTITPYNTFITLPTLVNGKTYNVTGVYIQYNTTKEIAPRTAEDFELNEVINKYTVTFDATENGTITVKDGETVINEGDEVAEGTTLTIECTPANADYRFQNWQYKVEGGSWNTRQTNPQDYAMPSANVKFRANFELIPVYTVAWSVNGSIVKSDDLKEGAAVTVPSDPEAVNGKVFTGWIETATVVGATPAYVIPSATAAKTVTYYAVFATQTGSGEAKYELVESALDNWTGDYLIVYNNTYAMNTHSGNQNANTFATYTDISKYYTEASKSIASNSTTDALVYRAAQTTNGYSLYSVSDESYLGITANTTSTGAKLRWNTSYTESADDWTLGVGSVGNVGSNTLYIRWNNNSGSYRFAAYASTGQQAIQLFKKEGGASYSDYTTTVAAPVAKTIDFVACDGKAYYTTFSNTKAVTIPEMIEVDGEYAEFTVYTVWVDGDDLVLMDQTAYDDVYYLSENEGYLIKAEYSGDVTFTGSKAISVEYTELDYDLNSRDEDNALRPTGNGITAEQMASADAGKEYFRLTMHNDTQCGFWWGAADGAAFALGANKAYLVADKAAGAKGFTFNWAQDTEDAIKAVKADSNEVIYNLAGQRINKMQKGINIVNGKKILK